MRRWLAMALLLVLLPFLVLPATANQRIALVIGNNAYPKAPLFNPVNDANAVSAELRGLGFEVVKVTDADLASMQGALLEFAGRIRDGATALVFFAGHGIQANGRNYLIPVDASLESAGRLRFEALEMGDVLEELEYSGSRLNLVILDACRNNPFLGRTRGASGGLAAVDAATGTLIAYATAPGATASDGSGSNGLYTEHLLQALRIPNLQAEEVFKQVRIAVAQRSGGEQVPWESSSLTGDFIFNQQPIGPGGSASPALVGEGAAGMGSVRERSAETLFWETVLGNDRVAGYQSYLDAFPDGIFSALAADRIAVLEAAQRQSNRCDDLSGAWLDWRGDRDCSSRNFFEADQDNPGSYQVKVNICGAGLLEGISSVVASATARLEGRKLTLDWRHGPCQGITEVELDAQCSSGHGMIIGQRGGFGTCARIRETVRLERADTGF
ncbi:MAG: caspase family protein [Gammaproteobacteria bacterium]|nr:caspase family protein [Gammaproteobacteria bacterium]